MAHKPENFKRVIAQNRKARYDYFIDYVIEAGIVLTGTEIKSLRNNDCSIAESFAEQEGGEIVLINSYIPEYDKGNRFNHSPRRTRKLLLHKREIKKLIGLAKKKGTTLVPLSIYLNAKNIAKLELAVVHGKKQHDKRDAIKKADWQREQARMIRDR